MMSACLWVLAGTTSLRCRTGRWTGPNPCTISKPAFPTPFNPSSQLSIIMFPIYSLFLPLSRSSKASSWRSGTASRQHPPQWYRWLAVRPGWRRRCRLVVCGCFWLVGWWLSWGRSVNGWWLLVWWMHRVLWQAMAWQLAAAGPDLQHFPPLSNPPTPTPCCLPSRGTPLGPTLIHSPLNSCLVFFFSSFPPSFLFSFPFFPAAAGLWRQGQLPRGLPAGAVGPRVSARVCRQADQPRRQGLGGVNGGGACKAGVSWGGCVVRAREL